MIKIVVIGAGGRMGKTIVSCIEDSAESAIAGGTEFSGHPAIGTDVGDIAGIGNKGIAVVENIEEATADCDAIIDFTTPESSLNTLSVAVKQGKALVIGTTGFSAEQKESDEKAKELIALLGKLSPEERERVIKQAQAKNET